MRRITDELGGHVMAHWADGWAWSRHAGRPRWVGDALRIEVGAERESVRWLLPEPTPDLLAEVLDRPHPEHTALKVYGDPEVWEPRFPAGWEADIPVVLMSRTLQRAGVPPLPEGYRLEVGAEGEHVVVVEVRAPDGTLAARGRCGLGEEYAVPDRIVTSEDHRRRGLGSVVMTVLGNAALDAGRLRAVLGASADGQALYEHLGWSVAGRRTGMYYRPRTGDGRAR